MSFGVLLLAAAAFAQSVDAGAVPTVNAQLFRPATDLGDALWIEDARARPGFGGRLIVQWSDQLLVYRQADGDETVLVDDLFQADLLAGYGVGPLRIALDLPLVVRSSGSSGGESGLGDISAALKLQAWRGLRAPLGFAVLWRISAPTASVNAPLGSSGVGTELTAVADAQLGPLRVATNLGMQAVPAQQLENLWFDDRLFYGLAGSLPLGKRSGIVAEVVGHAAFRAEGEGAGHALEALVGGWHRLATGPLVLRAAAGLPLTRGIGAPQARVVLGLGWEPEAP